MATEQSGIVIRRLKQADLASALAIQAANYPPTLRESEAAFASRLEVQASYCLAAMRGDTLVAYLLSHGWVAEEPPPIDTVLEKDLIPEVLFIHDLAVSSVAQGAGIGRKLIDHAFELAWRDGLRKAELIAIEGAARYWRALGFEESLPSAILAAKLATYGPNARWMTRDMASGCV